MAAFRFLRSVFWFYITAALFLVNLILVFYPSVTTPVPYRGVDVVSLQREDGNLTLVANFVKTDCQIRRVDVVGYQSGETYFLHYEDLDGLDIENDRSQGLQTLRLLIHLEDYEPDWVEVRTRHLCDSKMVDRVFTRVLVQELQ